MPSSGQAYAIIKRLAHEHRKGNRPMTAASDAVRKEVMSGEVPDHTETPIEKNAANEVVPSGVTLRDPEDFQTLRNNIFDGVMDEVKTSFPQTYGGVRVELHEPEYEDPESYDLETQKQALLDNKVLGRRLRGTLKLFDDKTGNQLDEKRLTLMRVPYLTERGTFLHNGSEYTSLAQLRLIPGPYTRRKANGELETHFNIKRGTGSAFRVKFEPNTALYKMDVKQSSMRLYSLLHDIGVPDDHLEKAWGKEVFDINKRAYDPRVFDKAYKHLVRKPNPEATRDEKAAAIRDALESMQVNKRVAQKNLPNLFDAQKSASWQAEFSKQATAKPMTVHFPSPAATPAVMTSSISSRLPSTSSQSIARPPSPTLHKIGPAPVRQPTPAQQSPVTFPKPITPAPSPAVTATPAAPTQSKVLAGGYTVDNLYDAIRVPETGSYKNPFIRTQHAPPKGSTAYGPVQMTGILGKDYASRYKNIFQPEELNYLQRFNQQADMFNKYGKNPNMKGYNRRYDYGGAGDLTSPQDQEMYERVAKRILEHKYTQSGGDIKSFVRSWRGADDPDYENTVRRQLGAVKKSSFEWEKAAFIKLAKGAIVMLPTVGGKYLLEKNPDNHEFAPSKLRPPGGGQEPGETLKQTIVREIEEEFGIPAEDTEDRIRLLGYEYRDQFKGSAVFELKDHGLEPGVYQASNSPEETITLVEADLDDPDYQGPKLDKLLSKAA